MSSPSVPECLPGYTAEEVAEVCAAKGIGTRKISKLAHFLDYFEDRIDALPGPPSGDFHHYILHVQGYGARLRAAYTQLQILRLTYKAFYAPTPFLRAWDAAITEMWREISPPKPVANYARRALRFSLPVEDLPAAWSRALADMSLGIDGEQAPAPAPSITKSIERKLCEVALVAQEADIPIALSVETASRYEKSLMDRERPLAPMTIKSSLQRLKSFAQYTGNADVAAHLASRLTIHERRAARSQPLKEQKIMQVPSYTAIFEDAFDMLGHADGASNPRVAQRKRNFAAALTLLCPLPLRVADTRLCFGEHLTWEGESYHLFLSTISKTQEPFQARFQPFYSLFIDQLVLQGSPQDYLEELREDAIGRRRPLFEGHDGSRVFCNYVSYAWWETYGTGSHIARAKIHDELARLGAAGVEAALRACGHRSERSAEHYRTQAFRLLAGDHVRASAEDDITAEEWNEYFGDT